MRGWRAAPFLRPDYGYRPIIALVMPAKFTVRCSIPPEARVESFVGVRSRRDPSTTVERVVKRRPRPWHRELPEAAQVQAEASADEEPSVDDPGDCAIPDGGRNLNPND